MISVITFCLLGILLPFLIKHKLTEGRHRVCPSHHCIPNGQQGAGLPVSSQQIFDEHVGDLTSHSRPVNGAGRIAETPQGHDPPDSPPKPGRGPSPKSPPCRGNNGLKALLQSA